MQQITINKKIKISGIGLHSGKMVTLSLLPAKEHTGIIFKRVDVKNQDNIINAHYSNVTDTKFCTVISNYAGVSVGTIEHLMSALASFLIDNIIIEIDSPEVPVLDGSSNYFVKEIKKVGLHYLNATKSFLKILKPVSISSSNWDIKIVPSDTWEIDATIDFNNNLIGKQNLLFNFNKDSYEKKISKARTFTFLKDIDTLKANGLALGGSLDNAIVIDDNRVLNKTGLRYKNEFIRHKVLDLIGDIYLGGYYIKGKIIANKMGHQANNLILREIFKDPSQYNIEAYPMKSDVYALSHYKHLYN